MSDTKLPGKVERVSTQHFIVSVNLRRRRAYGHSFTGSHFSDNITAGLPS